MTLSDQHREYLNAHAVTNDTIEHHLIRSEGDEIIFPWRDGDLLTEQRRPWPGDSGTYYWEKDKDLHFWNLRDAGPDSTILLVEGTKQSLAAVSHAPMEYSVLGMAGCEGWSKCDLSRFEGRRVILGLDADAGSNLSVYEAGHLFAEQTEFYEARVSYLWLPARGSQGLDDVLTKIPETKRTKFIEYLVGKAQPKPAERKPTTRKGARLESILPDTGDRVGVAINIDRKLVIDQITGAMKDKLDGISLFNYGDVLTRVSGHETKPLDKDSFHALLADTIACFHYTEATDKKPAVFDPRWPDPQTVGAVMSKAEEFSTLKRVVRVPFVRPDGSVCATNGYDRDTHTVLVLGGLEVSVPSDPSHEEVKRAAKFLMEEWLGDFPLMTEADKANALALVLTPFVRGQFPLVPLAILNGLEAGVGKNLLADCVSIVATGEAAAPLAWIANAEEMRKQITAMFAMGNELFVFDEAHVIEGEQMARALTSLTYGDRILGVSRVAKFPNQATWMSLGNQVQVNGDMSRRVYFIALRPVGTTLEDRDAREYRHPDIKRWTTENRAQLVSAALTVLRGWWAAGQPSWTRGAALGSFEPWDRLMSSVTAYAGYPHFLTDVKERRSEGDYDRAYWEAHIKWLRSLFGDAEFTTRQVAEQGMRDPAGYEAPPGRLLEDPSAKGYSRELGKAYGKHKDRRHGSLKLIKVGIGHASTNRWQVLDDSDGGIGGMPPTPMYEKNSSSQVDATCVSRIEEQGAPIPSLHTSRVAFDLETLSADKLHSSEPGTFIKLVGLEESVFTKAGYVQSALNVGHSLVGCNNFFFDSLAVDRHHGISVEKTIPGSRDLRVAAFQHDPPTSYETSPGPGFKSYSLDALGERYLGVPKSTKGKELAKEFKGWDHIPSDDPRFIEYCREDLELTAKLDEAIPCDPYEEREARVCAITARATLSGFKVDVPALQERAQELDERVAEVKQILADNYGFPLTNKQGKDARAPQRTKEGKDAIRAAMEAAGFPVDRWPTGKDGTLSLSKDVLGFALARAEKDYPDAVPVIAAVQEMNGIRNNSANVLKYTRPDGRVHPAFLPFQATGRWSVLEPGLTVLKKGVADSERSFLLPDDEEDLVSIDLDQIDIRCVAAHSQDENLIAILNDPSRDIHSEISVMAFGTAEGKSRHYAKSLDLGWLYGRGINGMVENTPGVTMEAAQRVDSSMREQFSRVLEWQSEVRNLGSAGVLLDNGFGRNLRVDPQRAYTQAPAMMGQSTTRDLIAEGLLDLAKQAPEVLPMLRVIVHDEVVLSVPRKDREEIARLVQGCMSRMWAPKGASIPVRISAGQGKPFVFGRNWAELYL